MKKFISGLIIGILITWSITTLAAVELKVVPNPYDVIINGSKADVDGYNINGSTYLKLANLKLVGVEVKFENKQILLTSATNTTSATNPTKQDDKSLTTANTTTPKMSDFTVPEINENKPTITFYKNPTVDNIPVYEHEGNKYVLWGDAIHIISKQYKDYQLNTYEMRKENQGKQIIYLCKGTTILKEYPYVLIQIPEKKSQSIGFSYDIWVNEIVPIITNNN